MPEVATCTVRITLDGKPLELDIKVPGEKVRPSEMIRVFQSLADVFVSAAQRAVETRGRSVSCRDHCGACCRQLVSITETDARHIRKLIESLPSPRREEILARFAVARQKLQAAGLLEELRASRHSTMQAALPLVKRYFELQIACPFLEDESCSIYADRPIACREYLVCSPAENCRNPLGGNIEGVQVPAQVSVGLSVLGRPVLPAVRPWVPFILVLDWVDESAEPSRPGPEILNDFFKQLSQSAGTR